MCVLLYANKSDLNRRWVSPTVNRTVAPSSMRSEFNLELGNQAPCLPAPPIRPPSDNSKVYKDRNSPREQPFIDQSIFTFHGLLSISLATMKIKIRTFARSTFFNRAATYDCNKDKLGITNQFIVCRSATSCQRIQLMYN